LLKLSSVIALWFLLLPSPSAAQLARLDDVLARAGAYVIEFERQFSGIVAEERYVQEVKRFGRSSMLISPMRRELRSDLLLVRPAPHNG